MSDPVLEAKRRQVIGHVRKQLGVEVKKMLAVAGDPKSYPDVLKVAGSEKKAKPLISQITKQILAGEERVRNSDLDGWAA